MLIPPAACDPDLAGAVVIFGESFAAQFIHSKAMPGGSIAAGL